MNYVSRNRKSGLAAQLYNFLQNLSEVARARDNVVLAVSIPASELEMTAEDQSDFERFKKLLDRLGKAVIMSAETETSEIIRRRLFEWDGLPKDAKETAEQYGDWLRANKQQLPSWFPTENAREAIAATYPFHPSVLSVFERKWRALPRFQQTRGVLRLLALWVSRAYSDGYKGAHKDPLISLGTAPLDDALFRAAMFEQLGESRLEGAVTTDIVGKEHAHAVRLDEEAQTEVKKARLHRKVATTILFESNGGQQRGEATVPEVRLAVAEPDLDIGNVEQCLEALVQDCYYLGRREEPLPVQLPAEPQQAPRRPARERGAARLSTRRCGQRSRRPSTPAAASSASSSPSAATRCRTAQCSPWSSWHPTRRPGTTATLKVLGTMTTEYGQQARTFKSGLIWCVAEDAANLAEEARKLLAWKDIEGDAAELKLDEAQRRQLGENLKRAERDLREAVWRTYKNLFLLGEDNELRRIDLGLVHSSAATSLTELVLSRLKQEDVVVPSVSPSFLVRYWPPALPEWSTKQIRDAFFASPKFPRLTNADAVRDTISRGLDQGQFAYVGKAPDGSYEPFYYKQSLPASEVEIGDDVFLIRKDLAEKFLEAKAGGKPVAPVATPTTTGSAATPGGPGAQQVGPGHVSEGTKPGSAEPPTAEVVDGLTWSGDLPHPKWMLFFTKVLSRLTKTGGLRLTVSVEVDAPAGIPKSVVDETKVALRELGLSEQVGPKKRG